MTCVPRLLVLGATSNLKEQNAALHFLFFSLFQNFGLQPVLLYYKVQGRVLAKRFDIQQILGPSLQEGHGGAGACPEKGSEAGEGSGEQV